MKKILFLLVFIPLISKAQKAPWGISQMQFGPQVSWSKQSETWNSGGYPRFQNQNNTSVGVNGRLQASFIDLLIYENASKDPTPWFRIVDLIGFEMGAGYQSENTSVSSEAYVFDAQTKTMWFNYGIDVGAIALFRLMPKLDLGAKYSYSSYVNSTFGNTNFVPGIPSGRNNPAYRNNVYWGLMGRYDRIYAELTFIRGREHKDDGTHLNILDIKYRYKENSTWAPYVGLQIAGGLSTFFDYHGSSPKSNGNINRSWVQLSIGKMTNF